MSPLLRALRAELLKLRGTLASWMCLIAPTLVVLVVVLQGLVSKPGNATRPPEDSWLMFAQGTMGLWAFLMLPLFVTLQAALLAGLEHGAQQWKHLLALPLPRAVHYIAKLFVLAAMVVAANLAMVVLIALAGKLLLMVNPDRFAFSTAPPWFFLFSRAGAICAAAALIVALHTWIAIRWNSFTVAVAAGMTATVAGFLIGQSADYGPWYPWAMPMQVLAGEGEKLAMVVATGLMAGSAAAAAGLWDFLRRDPG